MRDEQLYAFVADARAGAAASVRSRTRWLHEQLRADLSFAEICRDLSARAQPVEVTLAAGRTRRGTLVGTGHDVLALCAPAGETVYVALGAVVGVRALAPTAPESGLQVPAAQGHGAWSGARSLGASLHFADVVADLAEERAPVLVGTAAGVHRGVLAGMARDFIWFDGNAHCLRLDKITDVATGAAL